MITDSDFNKREHEDRESPEQQAAYWLAVLQNETCSVAQLKAFTHWLDDDPENQQAYDSLVTAIEVTSFLEKDKEILQLRKSALGLGKNKPFYKRSNFKRAMAACLAVFGIALAIIFWSPVQHSDISIADNSPTASDPNNLQLTTAIGEQLTRSLIDGSMIELNTDSKIRVQLSDTQRSIYLLQGQAVFSVAHDENRPFVVFAGDRKVTALGTTFEVRVGEEEATVTLLEGKVKVDEVILADQQNSNSSPPVAVELEPGERFISSTNQMISVDEENMHAELSWRQGRHIFVDEKISKIVAELNRYTERKIIIKDPQIGELRASANFKMGSTQSLSAALEANFGLVVTHDENNNTININWE